MVLWFVFHSRVRKERAIKNHDAIFSEIAALYEQWEKAPLKRNCTGLSECCRFAHTGKTPYLTKGEALYAAKGWRAAGRNKVVLPEDGSCPFLKNQRCQIYKYRPFACRTHFCAAAGGLASRAEVRDFIHRLEEIDRKLGGDGGCNLPSAMLAVM